MKIIKIAYKINEGQYFKIFGKLSSLLGTFEKKGITSVEDAMQIYDSNKNLEDEIVYFLYKFVASKNPSIENYFGKKTTSEQAQKADMFKRILPDSFFSSAGDFLQKDLGPPYRGTRAFKFYKTLPTRNFDEALKSAKAVLKLENYLIKGIDLNKYPLSFKVPSTIEAFMTRNDNLVVYFYHRKIKHKVFENVSSWASAYGIEDIKRPFSWGIDKGMSIGVNYEKESYSRIALKSVAEKIVNRLAQAFLKGEFSEKSRGERKEIINKLIKSQLNYGMRDHYISSTPIDKFKSKERPIDDDISVAKIQEWRYPHEKFKRLFNEFKIGLNNMGRISDGDPDFYLFLDTYISGEYKDNLLNMLNNIKAITIDQWHPRGKSYKDDLLNTINLVIEKYIDGSYVKKIYDRGELVENDISEIIKDHEEIYKILSYFLTNCTLNGINTSEKDLDIS
jgi:hypothetical protein